MGVYEETPVERPGMHWQQNDHRYVGSAYDPSRDLSPNLPVHSCDSSSMGDVEANNNCNTTSSGSSNCSTPSSSTSSTTSSCSNPPSCVHHHLLHHHHGPPPPPVPPHHRPPPCNNNCGGDTSVCPAAGPHLLQRQQPQQQQQHRAGFQDCEGGVFPNVAQPSSSPLLQPKLEQQNTPATPPTPQTSAIAGPCSDEVVVCAGCGHRISDRFYLLAVDRRWHAACLQCCQCRQRLDGEMTCYAREGNIYCKKDYYRLFGMKRCARCQAAILFTELVMRARDLVFHVHCFTCAVCNATLAKGDHFGMRDSAVLCRLHYELALSEQPPPSPAPAPAPPFPPSGTYHPPFPSPEFHSHHHHPHHPHTSIPPPPPGEVPGGGVQTKVPYFNGAAPPTGTTRQKGRPRKRKPKDLEAMTANLDLNADYLDVPFGRSGPGTPGLPGSNGQQRAKRMRTSFKHHQLRTMKSYFAINHNPDAKDLKQLSQKTGLPKRVLQVWFQNARAKWRRMMIKQEGKAGEKCSETGGSLGDMEAAYGPQAGAPGPVGAEYHQQALTPHSPAFILGGTSPSPLECSS